MLPAAMAASFLTLLLFATDTPRGSPLWPPLAVLPPPPRAASRLLRPAATDSRGIISAWAQRMGALRLAPAGWLAVTGLGLVNWLADAAVLAVSIHAAGAAIPWHDLLLVYGAGVA